MRHILLVDDEDSVRESCTTLLEQAGHLVSTAADMSTAVDLLRQHSFDLIISDIILPDDHGLHLLHALNLLEQRAPVIMTTGHPTVDSAAQALRQGAFDYLLKPVKEDELLRATQKALEHKELLDGRELLQEENSRYRLRLEELVHERTQQLTKANIRLQHEIEERLQAEKNLREHQERLALAMEISGAVAFESRPREGVFICSEHMAELTGVPVADLASFHTDYKKWLRRIHPEDRRRFHASFLQLTQGRRASVDEVIRLRRPEGKWAYLHVLARAAKRLPGGSASCLVGVLMDITTQTRDSELLKRQRDLGMALGTTDNLQQAADVVAKAILDLTGLEIFALYTLETTAQRLKLLHFTGLPPEIRSRLGDFDSDSAVFKYVMTLTPLYSQHQSEDELRQKALDEEKLKAVAMTPLVHEKRLVGAMCMASRKLEQIAPESRFIIETLSTQTASAMANIQSQQALRESEARYRNLVNTIPHGILELDLEGTILFCNQVSAARHGRSPEEMRGLKVGDLMTERAHRLALNEYLQRIVREHLPPEPFFFQVRNAQGALVELQADSNWSYDDNGNLRGLTSVTTDITARSQAERALQQAHEELEQRVFERTRELHEASSRLRRLATRQEALIEEERKRMAREIHDELGQNLTAVNMGLSVLWDALSANVPHEEQGRLRERVDMLRSTLEQMLKAVQRICQELRPMQLDDLGLGAALAWRIRDFEMATGVKATLHMDQEATDLEPELATAVYRLVQEALTNAARHANPSRVKVTVRQERERLLLLVEDDGSGIEPETLHSQDSFGLLGMRERMRAVGGNLSFQGHKGQGTTIRAEIPLAPRNKDKNART